MQEPDRVFLEKVEENLEAAQSEFISRRYNSSASRSYYACFQAAIYALAAAGIRPSREQWGHDFVQAQFNGELINRRRLYPASLRGVLNQNYTLRERADYTTDPSMRFEHLVQSLGLKSFSNPFVPREEVRYDEFRTRRTS